MKQRVVQDQRPSRAAGFTLVELLVVISITAILLAIGVPSFRHFMVKREIAAEAADFSRDINLARTEAIKRGVSVTVCRSDNPEATAPNCAAPGGDWASGWLVYVGPASYDPTPADIIRVQPKWGGGSVTNNSPSLNRIEYQPSGFSSGVLATFHFNPPAGMDGTTLAQNWTLNAVGRWAVAADSGD
jgi:type IV fimbrial biogenesis protein FimT